MRPAQSEVLASGGSSSGMEADQARDLAEVRGRRATKKKAKAEVERRASKAWVPVPGLARGSCKPGSRAPKLAFCLSPIPVLSACVLRCAWTCSDFAKAHMTSNGQIAVM